MDIFVFFLSFSCHPHLTLAAAKQQVKGGEGKYLFEPDPETRLDSRVVSVTYEKYQHI